MLVLLVEDRSDELGPFLRRQLGKLREVIAVSGYELWLVSFFLLKTSDRLPPLLKQALSTF
jgi:hypothetical protein